ncbi:MAG: VOC family protein [Gammaproteobacteria bacterium]|nr:VOC family protein [Gammaproteobacteria bacterium]
MTTPGVHPDSGTPYQSVTRAENPCVRAHDLALLEFAGPEPARARAFFEAFGLRCNDGPDGSLLCSAEAGAPVAVIYRQAPVAAFIGPTFTVKTPQELDQLAQRAGVAAPYPQDLPGHPPGVILRDPNGVQVRVACFNDWRELPACGPAPLANRGPDRARTNSPLRPPRRPSRVLRLGHMVLGTPQWEATARFYIDTLGLIPSDVQALPDGRPAVAFMRCDRGDAPADHHTFVVARLPVLDFEHAAFEVPDLDEVGMGGEVLREQGFRRAWGVGRHILGSQIFDYWFGPDGRKFEHFADGDLFDAARPTRYHAMSTAGLAQWGPPMPQAFLRPRLGWRELGQLLRNLLTDSGFGFRELRLLARALRSKSLPD